jgi:hypothetical protein
MTGLEIILVAVVWIAYGVFFLYQISDNEFEDIEWCGWVLAISLAPFWLIARAIIGIFSSKVLD